MATTLGSFSVLNSLCKMTSNLNKINIRLSGLETDFENIIHIGFIAHLRVSDVFLKTPTCGTIWVCKKFSSSKEKWKSNFTTSWLRRKACKYISQGLTWKGKWRKKPNFIFDLKNAFLKSFYIYGEWQLKDTNILALVIK